MLPAFTALLLCQLAGETLAAATGLPLPGPVIGMAILFLVLLARGGVPAGINKAGGALLANLSLLFVPAGVGIMTHAARLKAEAVPIGATLVLSTLATIAVTGFMMSRLGRSGGRADG